MLTERQERAIRYRLIRESREALTRAWDALKEPQPTIATLNLGASSVKRLAGQIERSGPPLLTRDLAYALHCLSDSLLALGTIAAFQRVDPATEPERVAACYQTFFEIAARGVLNCRNRLQAWADFQPCAEQPSTESEALCA